MNSVNVSTAVIAGPASSLAIKSRDNLLITVIAEAKPASVEVILNAELEFAAYPFIAVRIPALSKLPARVA